MDNNIFHTLNYPVTLRHARINAVDEDRFGMVSTDGGRFWLKPALGCLLQPEIGDTVLISVAHDEGYIIAVLERSIPTPPHIHFGGDLTLSLPAGCLNIHTREGVSVNAGKKFSLLADEGSAQIAYLLGTVGLLQICGERADSYWSERNNISLHQCDTAVRYTSEFGDRYQQIHGHDETQAGSLRQRVDKEWTASCESIYLCADITVTIDGQLIRLG